MDINLEGKTIKLKLVEEKDAEFICRLRSNESLNQYISRSNNNVEEQQQWIRDYKKREKKAIEYYFIIYKIEGNVPIGTVRLYDFRIKQKSFCWGSWILNENKTKYAALESALLVYKLGFEQMNFEQSHFDVMKGNVKVQEFHTRMGAKKTYEDDKNIYYLFKKLVYERDKLIYRNFLMP